MCKGKRETLSSWWRQLKKGTKLKLTRETVHCDGTAKVTCVTYWRVARVAKNRIGLEGGEYTAKEPMWYDRSVAGQIVVCGVKMSDSAVHGFRITYEIL